MGDVLNCASCFEDITKNKTTCSKCDLPLHKDCAINDGGTYCDTCYTSKSTEKETVDIDVIRRTHIELYKKCPYAFYLEVVKGNQQQGNMYTTLGSDLHELFEKYSLVLEPNPEEIIQEFNDKFWSNYSFDMFGTEEKQDAMYQRAIKSIREFVIAHNQMLPPIVLEQKIIFSIGDNVPNISITMDRINEVDGELEIADWKTGKVMVGKKLSTDLQAPLYIYAVREYYKRPVRKFTLYYVNEGKEREFVRINDDEYVCTVVGREYKISLTEAIREVKSLFSQIVKGNFSIPKDTNKMHFTCNVCEFKRNGMCKGAEEQPWGLKV